MILYLNLYLKIVKNTCKISRIIKLKNKMTNKPIKLNAP